MADSFKAGYVAIVGRPNVGKSTLLNRLLGQKISIVTPKPQTTRNRILGIHTLPGAQIVFLDTPGIHRSDRRFNREMVRAALRAVEEADLILWMVDAEEPETPDDLLILEELRRAKPPVFLLINKVDRVAKDLLLPLMDRFKDRLPFQEIVPLSAAAGDNVDRLEALLLRDLPEGRPFFPEDQVTDRPERFFIAELVREQAFQLLRQELPYAVAVTVEQVRERGGTRPGEGDVLVDVGATLYVEKASQKGIVIGAGGQMLKQIGQRSRLEIEALLGRRVNLQLHVKVRQGWRGDERALRELGYLEQG
ncbi:MAG TPA: GTPase Era [Candidatus Methylomirabilis sp.]|jgi:GTP-binding protein Era